jgi:hypothetical protein
VSAWGSRWLASSIPIDQLIFTKCYFFLDTIFLGFYTFVNCKVSLAGSMSTRQRENRKNGNQESSSKEASEEGSQENSKEEVSKQRNRQHNRGTPKASPDVFLGNAASPVFMRLRQLFSRRASGSECKRHARQGRAPLTAAAAKGMVENWTSGVWRCRFRRESSRPRPRISCRACWPWRTSCGFPY